MAIYNVEKYLEEAIESVITQELSFIQNIQLILVNDGSPDNCDVICKKYKKKYPLNVIYIEQKNGGVSSARNAGISVATGKYINFLDSDDYFSKNTFLEVKKAFDKYETKTDVVAVNLVNFENSEGSWVNGSYFNKTRLINMEEESNFMQCQVGASFIRNEIVQKYRFDTNMKIHEDSHFLYRIFCDNPNCGVISNIKATYWHRIRANGTSATQTIKYKTNMFSITQTLFMELIKYYLQKKAKVPNFLQTFIILELNYYVISKIAQCDFKRKEKNKLKKDILYILENINNENISNHFVLNEIDKRILLEAKQNVGILFKKQKLKKENIILMIYRKLIHRILRGVISRVDLLELKINEANNDINNIHCNLNNNYGNNEKKLKETYNVVEDINNKHAETTDKIENMSNIISKIDNRVFLFENNINDINKEILSTNLNFNEINNKIDRVDNNIRTELLEIRKEQGFYENLNIKYCLYFHGGSRNHGCEALVKTIATALTENKEEILLHTFRKSEDVYYNINKFVKYIKEPIITDYSKQVKHMGETMFNDDMGIPDILPLLNDNSIAISIGGDNYCYGDYVTNLLSNYNTEFHRANIKTALIGCSIEPEIIQNKNIQRDLNKYDLILARETITYNALLQFGIDKNTHLIPDSAFILEQVDLPLPDNFLPNNTIGLNISPLVQSDNSEENIMYKNYVQLIEYIINKTQYNIAFIPHVFWQGSNDMETLTKLYNAYCYTGRVVLIYEHSCEELKGYISRCKMFIGARTHATIAAYSTFVPTIAIGYSVKSKGIAQDLFGTYENYVLPIDNISSEEDLTNSFLWLEKNYEGIKQHLQKTMSLYIKPLKKVSKYFEDLKNKPFLKELPYKPDCTGCSTCKNICPQKCISMVEDNEGFIYPEVDYSKCTNCNICKNTCPRNNNIESHPHQNAFAVKNKNINTREASSSGGVFTELAKYVLDNSGIVFGASYNDIMEVEHIMVDSLKDLKKLQGSKYVQSNIGTILIKVKEQLENNKLVLFSGVPCQIQGLKQFLKIDYSNLICVDVVCHGVPSPKVFRNYLNKVALENNSKITNLSFRNKDNGWKNYNLKTTFENKLIKNVIFSDDIYMKGFLKNLYLRPSCNSCIANNFRSGSDITLGDYWGIEKIEKDFDDDKGVSLVLLNTQAGEKIFNKISDNFDILKSDINFAIKNNPSIVKCWDSNKNRQNFFDNIDNIDIIQNITDNLDS